MKRVINRIIILALIVCIPLNCFGVEVFDQDLDSSVTSEEEALANEALQKNNKKSIFKIFTKKFERSSKEEKRQNVNKKEKKEKKDNSKVDIKSDEMNYDPKTEDVIATGNARVYFEEDDVTIYAEKIVFNYSSNSIKAHKNVRIFKNGKWVYGDYIIVDLNKGNSLIENPITKDDKISLTSQYGSMTEDKIKAYWGNVKFNDQVAMRLETRTFGIYFPLEKEFQEELFYDEKLPEQAFRLKAKKVFVKRGKEHDEVELKKAQLYRNNTKITNIGDIALYTDKEQAYAEFGGLELGSEPGLGMFLGYGVVAKLPKASTLKITPVLVLDQNIGVGILGRFMNKYNRTEVGYGSANGKFIMRGRHKIADDWNFDYGVNSYVNDWYMGRRRPEIIGQLVHHKAYDIQDLGMSFENRFNFAFAKDYYTDMSTFRAKWQTQSLKNFISYTDEDNKFDLALLEGEYFVMATSTYKTEILRKSGLKLLEKTFYVDMQYNVVPITRVNNFTYYHLDIYRYFMI